MHSVDIVEDIDNGRDVRDRSLLISEILKRIISFDEDGLNRLITFVDRIIEEPPSS